MQRARAGDVDAFAVLYDRHHAGVFRFVARLLGSMADAEDVTHDCFLALVTGTARFDPDRGGLRTFLCATARNQAFKVMRAKARTATESHEEADGASPLRALIEGEVVSAVECAVRALSPLQREVLILVEYEACTLAEAAAIAGTDVGTVKSRLHRARAALRRSLAPSHGSIACAPGGRTDERR